jgi:hypothetical protein
MIGNLERHGARWLSRLNLLIVTDPTMASSRKDKIYPITCSTVTRLNTPTIKGHVVILHQYTSPKMSLRPPPQSKILFKVNIFKKLVTKSRNCWVFGLRPSSGILKKNKLSSFLDYRMMDKVQKPDISVCYTIARNFYYPLVAKC